MEKYEKFLDGLYNHFTPDNPDPIERFEIALKYFRKEMMICGENVSIELSLSIRDSKEACVVCLYDILPEATGYEEPIFSAVFYDDEYEIL